MGNEGHEGVRRHWRLTSMGNTRISRGMGNKGKSPSHLHISFPTKKLPSALPHQGPSTSYSYVSYLYIGVNAHYVAYNSMWKQFIIRTFLCNLIKCNLFIFKVFLLFLCTDVLDDD